MGDDFYCCCGDGVYRGESFTHHRTQMKNKVLLAFGLVLTFLVTGCDSMKGSSEAKSKPQYTVLYQGDSPEAGRWKGLGMCMASVVAQTYAQTLVDQCESAFDRNSSHND